MRRRLHVPAALALLLVCSCDDTSDGTGGAGGAGSSSSAATTDATSSAASTSAASTSATTSSTSDASSSSSGGGCVPGTVEACYTGPIATKDVGTCIGGMRTCDATGTFGPCVGEIVPADETCLTPEDEDCDGAANEEGDGCVCVPGETVACYTGPANTMGVGACTAGTTVCDAQGQPSGACTGEVLPATENCLAAPDEDCDGAAQPCTGTGAWAKRFGDNAAQRVRSVAAVGGGVVITGAFAGTVDFGGGPLTSAGGTDVFLARYDADGNHLWSKRFGNAAAQTGVGVATDAAGNVYVVGEFAGQIDLDGQLLTSGGLTDVFVAKFDGNGVRQWARRFGSTFGDSAGGIAVSGSFAQVTITGTFIGMFVAFPTQVIGAGGTDVFLLSLLNDGTVAWAKGFGDTADQAGVAVAVGPLDEIVLVANNAGNMSVGVGGHTSAGSTDVLVAEFDASGEAQWSKQFGDASAQTGSDVAIDANGEVTVVGTFQGQVNFGGGSLLSAGSSDIFVAHFQGFGSGPFGWAKRFGGAGADSGRAVAVDPFGGVVVASDFSGAIDFGGGALMSAGGTDVGFAKYDALGTHVWSRRAGDAAAQNAEDIAADASTVFLAGTFAGNIDLGTGPLMSSGSTDVFLAGLAP